MNIHYRRYSLDSFLDAQVAAGIESIEFWTGVPHYFMDAMSYSDCRSLQKKIRQRGLTAKVFTPENCMYQYQFSAAKPEMFQKSLAYFTNGIYAAAELGCGIMQCNSGWGYLDESREEAWKRAVEMISLLAREAAREGIVLAMESLRPEETNLVHTLEDTKKFIKEVGEPNLKVLIDTTAMGVAGETLTQWFEAFGEDIVHMHFVDGNPYGHLIWGDGSRNLEEDLKVLKKYGYQGGLGQEITDHRYFTDPAGYDRKNMRMFEQFL